MSVCLHPQRVTPRRRPRAAPHHPFVPAPPGRGPRQLQPLPGMEQGCPGLFLPFLKAGGMSVCCPPALSRFPFPTALPRHRLWPSTDFPRLPRLPPGPWIHGCPAPVTRPGPGPHQPRQTAPVHLPPGRTGLPRPAPGITARGKGSPSCCPLATATLSLRAPAPQKAGSEAGWVRSHAVLAATQGSGAAGITDSR